MYAVSARIQGAEVITLPLRADDGFALAERAVLERCTPDVKLVFLCSPNNPTGNLLDEQAILRLAAKLAGRSIVVVDEAYIEFAGSVSLARHLPKLPHLAILRTLSKAHGLAGARCGTLIADPEVIALLRKVIPPYAIPQLTLEAVIRQLSPVELAESQSNIEVILSERQRLSDALAKLRRVARVWHSDADFILAQFDDAGAALQLARDTSLLVRDARGYPGLGQALRITVGSVVQNNRLLEAWQ
jgi:histidinol-phosphate aminotransferase